MRRLRQHFAVLALVAAAACSEGTGSGPPDAGTPPPPAAPARLDEVKGEVKLEHAGKVGPAAPGDLFVGDAVETGEAGEAKVRFPGGRFVEIGPDARFTLAEGEGGLVLNVARGLVLTRVPNDAPAAGPQVALSILTPFGLTRIGRSEVAVDVGKDSASVDVKVGAIEMVSRNGEVTRVGVGEKVELGKPKPVEAAAVGATLLAGGKSELKKKDAKSWVALGKKATPVETGDQLRVKDGRTTLEAEGSASRLVFGRGAEAGFVSIARAAGVEKTQLDFKRGELSGVLAGKQKSRLELGGGVSLVSDLGGQFTLVRTATGLDFSAIAGDFKLEREGAEPQAVTGGQSAKVTAKAVTVAEAARDVLQLPARQGMKVYHAGLGRISLTWDGEDDRPYRVEVASGPSYTDPLISGVLHQRFVSVPTPARGNLYWRVFDGEKEVAKGAAYFSPEPKGNQELDLRRNEVHDGSDKASIYFQDKPPAVTFLFTPERPDAGPAVAKYKVAVFKDGALGTPLVERVVKEEKLVLDGALGEGKYLWSVTPLDASGAGLRGGKMNKLEIVYDNAIPNLVIKSPQNGDPGGPSVKVVGIAPVGAKVFLNGKALSLDDKARFDTTAAPLPGGKLVFRMLGKNGAEVYTVRTVRR